MPLHRGPQHPSYTPLDGFSLVTIPYLYSVTVWTQFAMQILSGVPTPKSPLPVGRPGPPSNTMLLGTTSVSLSNGIHYVQCFSRVHECDRQTDGPLADTSVAIGGIAAFSGAA